MGLKLAALICSWANSGQKTQRPKNSAATSEEPGAKTGCWKQKWATKDTPCTQHHQRGGQTTWVIPPAWPMDTRPPLPHTRNKLTTPRAASKQGNLLFVRIRPCCSWGPSKAWCDTRCGIQIPFRYMMQEYQLENEHQNWPWNSGSPELHTKTSKSVLQKIFPQLKHLRLPQSSWNKFTIKIFKSQGDTYYPKENQQLWPTVELAFQELETPTISKY